jgi:hypothetical protein
MVLKRCSSERGEREKRFYGGGKGERRNDEGGEKENKSAVGGDDLLRKCKSPM